MKRKILLLFISVVLSFGGCAIKSGKNNDRSEIIERNFVGGFIRVEIEKGQLKKIISEASAPVIGDNPSARTNAAKVAEAKARVQIEKMKETFIQSVETVESQSSSNERDDGKGNALEVVSDSAIQVITSIVQRIESVQRGVYVVNESYNQSSNTVTVTVESDSAISELLDNR